jgi:hypothetical protein
LTYFLRALKSWVHINLPLFKILEMLVIIWKKLMELVWQLHRCVEF